MSIKGRILKSTLFQRIVKLGIRLTPKILVVSVANLVLKGIAKFSTIKYDLNTRTAFVKVTLHGEEEPIEVTVDGYAILNNKNKYQFVLYNARSNKPWLTNIFARIVGKEWTIPQIPQLKDEIEFIANLLKPDSPKQAKSPGEKVINPDVPMLTKAKSNQGKK